MHDQVRTASTLRRRLQGGWPVQRLTGHVYLDAAKVKGGEKRGIGERFFPKIQINHGR